MTATDAFDLFVRPAFFDASFSARLAAQMSLATAEPAVVHGHAAGARVAENMRRTLSVAPTAEAHADVVRALDGLRGELGRHFRIGLSELDAPQFLRYRVGDFFVAHQDGNTGMLRLPTEARRVSVVVFLSVQSEVAAAGTHTGGSLVFHDWRAGKTLPFRGAPGTLVAFRAETTHEVTPVTHGERLAIAGWYR